jgi:tRNA-specific 2-thiouridylase
VGQRKGLGIAHPTPLYVQKIDIESNRLIVGDNDSLFRGSFVIEDVNWVGVEPTTAPFEADVKIRYLHYPRPARLEPLPDDRLHVTFREAQRAITPGQSAVFYDGDIVLGGGVIA